MVAKNTVADCHIVTESNLIVSITGAQCSFVELASDRVRSGVRLK